MEVWYGRTEKQTDGRTDGRTNVARHYSADRDSGVDKEKGLGRPILQTRQNTFKLH